VNRKNQDRHSEKNVNDATPPENQGRKNLRVLNSIIIKRVSKKEMGKGRDLLRESINASSFYFNSDRRQRDRESLREERQRDGSGRCTECRGSKEGPRKHRA